MALFIGIFIIFVFLLVIFSFFDLHNRQKAGKLLLTLQQDTYTGELHIDEHFKEIEIWLKTTVRAKGLKVTKGNLEISLDGPVKRNILLEEDNKSSQPGTRYLISFNTQRKSLGELPKGKYNVHITYSENLQLEVLEIRGYTEKYWLSFMAK